MAFAKCIRNAVLTGAFAVGIVASGSAAQAATVAAAPESGSVSAHEYASASSWCRYSRWDDDDWRCRHHDHWRDRDRWRHHRHHHHDHDWDDNDNDWDD